ncbi:hypothetical protein ACJQWK_01918 [Exserohilum turcicum]
MPSPHRPESFLRQLLSEIGSTDTPTAPHTTVSLQGSTRPTASRVSDRPAPSVWVGGASAALDARQKLRAADEARSKKTATPQTNDDPPSQLKSVSHGNDTPEDGHHSTGTAVATVKYDPLPQDGHDSPGGDARPPLPQPRPSLGRLDIPRQINAYRAFSCRNFCPRNDCTVSS